MSLTRIGRLLAFGACIGTAFAIQGCVGFGPSPHFVVRDPPSDSSVADSANVPSRPATPALVNPSAVTPGGATAVRTSSQVVAPGVIVVGTGDTLYSVARAYGVPIRGLIDSNGLIAPYDLTPGQRLRLPPRHDHVVAAGESLYGIAQQYGIDTSSLVRLNGLRPPYTLTVGERLRIPAPTVTIAAPGPAPAATRPPIVTASTTAPPPPASNFAAVQVQALPPPHSVTAEPVANARASAASILPVSATDVPLVEPEAKPSLAAPGHGLENHDVAAATVPRTELPTPIPPPDRSAVSAAIANAARGHRGPIFSWPIHGTIISTFGGKKGGEHNDGINISAVRGEPVRAADDGVVAYAGNELRGFGNLVLIRHAGGWTTAYAHNEVLLVHRGEVVKRGQVIARAGSTGSVATPQLHFEIRRGRQALDPRLYLAAADSQRVSSAASRDVRQDPE